MIKRLYVHNYKCLVNFELRLADTPNALLIGKNGTGKSSIGQALELLREIARGNNVLLANDGSDPALVEPADFWQGHLDEPMRFTLEALLHGREFRYDLALEFPEGFRGLRVFEESLTVDGQPIYTRERAQVSLLRNEAPSAGFRLDWHTIALPLLNAPLESDPVHQLRVWLSRMILLSPVPSRIHGGADGVALSPDREAGNLGKWLTGILQSNPASYAILDRAMRDVFPDFAEIKIPHNSPNRQYTVTFLKENARISIPFNALSDGEKCFILGATVLAANKAYGPLFCFWDEPDNFLATSELNHFILNLRRAFQPEGQLLLASHHTEAIARFSDENTFVMSRNSHLEPARIQPLSDIRLEGSLHDALLRGDLA